MSDSTPTLERVAQAIYAQAPDIRMMNSLQSTLSWDETSEWMREQCRRQARAALDASGNDERNGQREHLLNAVVADADLLLDIKAWLQECHDWLLETDLDMRCPMQTDPLDLVARIDRSIKGHRHD